MVSQALLSNIMLQTPGIMDGLWCEVFGKCQVDKPGMQKNISEQFMKFHHTHHIHQRLQF